MSIGKKQKDKFSILLSQHTSNDSKGGENKNMSKRQITLGTWNKNHGSFLKNLYMFVSSYMIMAISETIM